MPSLSLMISQLFNGSQGDRESYLNTMLIGWAASNAYQILNATRNANEVITSATVQWPDGCSGTYTALVINGTFPTATDSFQITYVYGGRTKTVTQPTITSRDSAGAVLVAPAMTVR